MQDGDVVGVPLSRVVHSPYPDGYDADKPHEAAHCSILAGELGDKALKRRLRALYALGRFTNFDPQAGAVIKVVRVEGNSVSADGMLPTSEPS